MRVSQLLCQKRGLDPQEASEYIGSEKLLMEYVNAGWLRPFVQRKRLTRYDRNDLDRCIDRHKLEEPRPASRA